MHAIQEQITLPWRIAFEVVLQGIRIRLGRSLITLSGIALGTAFLMSLLAASTLRESIREEMTTREHLTRMTNFLILESGPLNTRKVTILREGPASPIEERLLQHLSGSNPPFPPYHRAHPADVVIFIGDPSAGEPPITFPKDTLVAITRNTQSPRAQATHTVQLDRAPSEEELATAAANERKAAARKIWIVTIALIVTVIGICNSLLMSVTERFREIGTMKCLGARSSFIRRLFFIESALLGTIGSLAGAIGGLLFAFSLYGLTYGFGNLLESLLIGQLVGQFFVTWAVGLVLSILAAIYPANRAASMVPATALRSNI